MFSLRSIGSATVRIALNEGSRFGTMSGRLRPMPVLHIQNRSYYYFPLSWAEFKERFQRWVETAEQRLVKVQLISRRRSQRRHPVVPRRRRKMSKFMSRTSTTWNVWFQKQRQEAATAIAEPPLSSLPLPIAAKDNNKNSSGTGSRLRAEYQGWKSRQNDIYQGWKSRRKEQYQKWKARRQEQYLGWKRRNKIDWIRTKQVLLHEYSRPEWFDELGRPLTSQDALGRYVNPWQSQSTNGLHSIPTLLNWRWQRFRREFLEEGGAGSFLPKLAWNTASPALATPDGSAYPLPEIKNDALSVTWIGHSTCWIQINGFTIVTDPIFSLRSSPYQSLPIGIPRDVPPSHSIEQLVAHANGKIDFCCISHDHYDHMDRDSVLQLAPNVHRWIVPVGIGNWLSERGNVPRSAVIELEWWQQVSFLGKGVNALPLQLDEPAYGADERSPSLTFTLTPAQHWSSRTMSDRNLRLWGSFAMKSPSQNFFFCGDTGYPESFPLFRQIADTLGPFDIACIPIGAYKPEEMNRDAHVNPMEAVKIHKDLMSRHSIAIHWGTFSMGEEDIHEPPRDLMVSLEKERTMLPPFDTLQHGATLQIENSAAIAEATIGTEGYASESASL